LEGKLEEKSVCIRSTIRSKIKWIVLFFDGDDVSTWFHLLKSLIGSLPPKTQFLIGCSEQTHIDILWANTAIWANAKQVQKTERGQTLQKATCYLHLAPRANEFVTIWCRDPFFFKSKAQNGRNIYFSKTGYAPNNDFIRLNWSQLNFPTMRLQPSNDTTKGKSLYLSGGNFLADENFILVGYLEFRRTWLSNNTPPSPTFSNVLQTEQAALDALLSWANDEKGQPFRTVHLIGKGISFPKPSSFLGDKVFAHIDCYVSLTGSHRTNSNGQKKYVLLVARIEGLFLSKNAPQTDWDSTLTEWNTCLDAVAKQLKETGDFEVWRNPIPAFALCDWDFDLVRPYLGLMNNVLTEITKSSKKVWLSTLTSSLYPTDADEALARIEQTNISLWKDLGFDVGVIKADFHPFWKWFGGLRCLTNHF
jgi:hypothetical protein